MDAESRRRRDPRIDGLIFVAAMVAIMWVSEGVDVILDGRLDRYGIQPRDVDALPGIFAAPFLHAGFQHLIGNTVPFVVMGAVIALSGLARVLSVTAIVIVIGGLGTWLIGGSHTVVIGASGVVFGYAAYLLTRALFDPTRRLLHLGVAVVIGILWGGVLLADLVPQDGISWQGHLFGAIAGVIAARLLAPDRDAGTPAGPRSPAALSA